MATAPDARADLLDTLLTSWLEAQRAAQTPREYLKERALHPDTTHLYDEALVALRSGNREEARRLLSSATTARQIWETFPSIFGEQPPRGYRKVRGWIQNKPSTHRTTSTLETSP